MLVLLASCFCCNSFPIVLICLIAARCYFRKKITTKKKEKRGEISFPHGRELHLHIGKKIGKGRRSSRLWESVLPSRGIQTSGVWSWKWRLIFFFSPSKAVFCIVNTFIPLHTQALPIYPCSNNYIVWSYNFNIPPVLKELSGGVLILFKRINPTVQQMPYRKKKINGILKGLHVLQIALKISILRCHVLGRKFSLWQTLSWGSRKLVSSENEIV